MEVVQIVPSLEARHGGPSVSVPALAAALGRLGTKVHLLACGPEDRQSGPEDGVSVRIFRRSFPWSLSPAPGLARFLSALSPAVIHNHGLWLRPLHYAHRAARARRIPLVISPRGMMSPWAWRHHRLRKAAANVLVHPGALAAASGWHATGEAEAEEIRALDFRQPVCVAPNGVTAPDPAERTAARSYWQARCPEAFQRPTALFYSRFHPKKRIEELIGLWSGMAPSDWLLLVVGIPEAYDVSRLEALARSRAAADRIRIFDGTTAPAPYVAGSLFLLPSHSENFGMVVAEALAHGVPAIATDATPWQDLTTAGAGWCVSWTDYADALRAALAEGPERLRERGAVARRWVLERYSWERPARLLLEFYASLAP